MSRCARRSTGFTLVEILASLLVFTLGVMGIIALVSQGLRTSLRAQADATAWATAMSVLKDPLPLGCLEDPATRGLHGWSWTRSGGSWTATEAGGTDAVWSATTWPVDQASDVLVPDMDAPVANNPAVFPVGGTPITGCARGWINGYYVERREQSRASDRIARTTRLVEVRVDVYWASSLAADSRPLASAVDRAIRQGVP